MQTLWQESPACGCMMVIPRSFEQISHVKSFWHKIASLYLYLYIHLSLHLSLYIWACVSIHAFTPEMCKMVKSVKWSSAKKVLCYTLHGVGNQRYGGSLALPHDLFVNNHYFCKCRFSEVSLCEWQCILFFTWYLQQLLLSYIEIIMISVSSIYSLSKSYSDCHAG